RIEHRLDAANQEPQTPSLNHARTKPHRPANKILPPITHFSPSAPVSSRSSAFGETERGQPTSVHPNPRLRSTLNPQLRQSATHHPPSSIIPSILKSQSW